MASDKKLVQKALKGNKTAFGKLVELYQDYILNLAFDYLGNYEEAKDAAQDVFMKAYNNLKTFNQKSEFKTWIYRIAVNTNLDYLKKQNSMLKNTNLFNKEVSENINRDTTVDIWDDRFKDAINTLSENQYSAVVLKYFHDKSTSEISEILECDINTVRVHLFRGIEKLKQLFKTKNK